MKEYEKDLCYYYLDDEEIYTHLLKTWKHYSEIFYDEISIAFEQFYETLEVITYRKLHDISHEKMLGSFYLDLVQSLNYQEMGDFIIDFF